MARFSSFFGVDFNVHSHFVHPLAGRTKREVEKGRERRSEMGVDEENRLKSGDTNEAGACQRPQNSPRQQEKWGAGRGKTSVKTDRGEPERPGKQEELPGTQNMRVSEVTQGSWRASVASRIKRVMVERLLSTSARKSRAVTLGRPKTGRRLRPQFSKVAFLASTAFLARW